MAGQRHVSVVPLVLNMMSDLPLCLRVITELLLSGYIEGVFCIKKLMYSWIDRVKRFAVLTLQVPKRALI